MVPDNINPNSIEILYGNKPEITSFYALNHYLLIAKYHVYLARNQSETPSLPRSFSPYWKVKLNAKDKWPLKTLIKKNTELSGPLSASAMREHLICSALK